MHTKTNEQVAFSLACLVRAKAALYLSITLQGYMFHKAKCRACVRLTARSLSTASKQATVDLFLACYRSGYIAVSVRLACLPAAICSMPEVLVCQAWAETSRALGDLWPYTKMSKHSAKGMTRPSFGSSCILTLLVQLIVRVNTLLTQLPDRETHQSFGARDSLLRMTHPRGCGCTCGE